jgi:hypothetical protein
MGEACGTYREDEKCMHSFSRKDSREETNWLGDLGGDWSIILKCIVYK